MRELSARYIAMQITTASCPFCNELVPFPPLSNLAETRVIARLTCGACDAVFVPVSATSDFSARTLRFTSGFLTRYSVVGLVGNVGLATAFLMRQTQLQRLVTVTTVSDGSYQEAADRLLGQAALL